LANCRTPVAIHQGPRRFKQCAEISGRLFRNTPHACRVGCVWGSEMG
jgi:hypothetical protein